MIPFATVSMQLTEYLTGRTVYVTPGQILAIYPVDDASCQLGLCMGLVRVQGTSDQLFELVNAKTIELCALEASANKGEAPA